MGIYLTGYLTSLIVLPEDQLWPMFNDWAVGGFEVAGALLCLARGLRRRTGRAVPVTLGLALLMWAAGDLVLTVESRGGRIPATPSYADICWLAFFPFCYVALVLFVRGEVRKLTTPSWLDGAVAGAGAAAVCAAFAFHSIHSLAGGSGAATATNVAYPIGDVILLCLIAGGSTMVAGRRLAPWILIAAGIFINVVGDTANLFDSHLGETGFVLDAIAWPASILALSMAVWIRPRPSDPFATPKAPTFVIPGISTLAALAVLLVGNLRHTSRIALLLATVTLLLVGMRLMLSIRGMNALSQQRRKQALTDELTGLANRRCLSAVLDAFFDELDLTEPEPRQLAFLFIDLDHFKEINDTFGHPAGDQLLRQMGPRLSTCLRADDLLVRLGGDEFVVLLLDGDATFATTVAQRISDALAEPFELDAMKATVSASIGIALAPTDATDSAGLLWCADIAMYRAKLGGVPFAVHQPDLDRGGNRLLLLEELRTAIECRQLVLHYQPQLDLRTGAVVAAEALLRWAHPAHGLVPPLEFLPFAEEAGLMRAITRLVLREAIAQCATWRREGKLLNIAVNISATNLLDPHLTYLVRELLDIHGLPPEALVLEITETSVISDFEHSARVIQELRDFGVVVSVDDFGAGFTSLAHLSSLAVKELKLDRAFISRLTDADGTRDLNLVRATIELGHSLGLRIVAEGIEDLATLELLSELGCDIGQGYFIGVPKPAEHLAFRPQPAAPADRIPHQVVGHAVAGQPAASCG
jgi:diguanylate cyclase (GGDEF)-like protein